MCVIIVVTGNARIDADILARATFSNSDGVGIAWRENGAVRFRKGLTDVDALHLCNTLPRPYVFHARLATVGGKCAELAHPFPIELEPSPSVDSEAPAVLFHNGHVQGWRPILMAAGGDPDDKRTGLWSDSRAIAHAVAMSGYGILSELAVGNRFVAFGARKGKMFGDWTRSGELFFSSHIPVSVPAYRYSKSNEPMVRTTDANTPEIAEANFQTVEEWLAYKAAMESDGARTARSGPDARDAVQYDSWGD